MAIKPKKKQDYTGRVKEILKHNDLTIADFCRKIGLPSHMTIYLLVQENRKPSLKTIQRIISAFPGVTEEWLLYGNGNYNKNNQSDSPSDGIGDDDLTVTASQVTKIIKEYIDLKFEALEKKLQL